MSQRIDVINYLTGLFSKIVPETHYLKNKNKTVVYPYQTFSLTGEPTHFAGQGFFIRQQQERRSNRKSIVSNDGII